MSPWGRGGQPQPKLWKQHLGKAQSTLDSSTPSDFLWRLLWRLMLNSTVGSRVYGHVKSTGSEALHSGLKPGCAPY